MLKDIEIAQNAQMKKIKDIAADLGVSEEELEPYGHYKAKITVKILCKNIIALFTANSNSYTNFICPALKSAALPAEGIFLTI